MRLTTDKNSAYAAADTLEAFAKGLRARADEARYVIVTISGALPETDIDELPSDGQRARLLAALGLPCQLR